jgi:hypothetical protein
MWLMSYISSVFSSLNIPSAQASGQAALATSNQQLNQDAQQVANPDNENLDGTLPHLNQDLQLAQAGAAVIRTSNEMLGSLLDAFA